MRVYQRNIVSLLQKRLEEQRRFIQVLVGPRQVGKTTAITQLEEHWNKQKRNLFVLVSADDVAESESDWINRVWDDVRKKMLLSKAGEAVLVFDEIQKISGWSETVKRNWDKDTHDKVAIKVLLSGSSRMLIQEGLSESLFGRFEQHYLAHWSYKEMNEAFGATSEQYAFYGAYPGFVDFIDDDTRYKNLIQGSVVEASLNRDIFLLSKIDKPALLRQLFELGVKYSGQILSYTKMMGQLHDAGNTTTLARYLHLLDQAGLVGGLEKYSNRDVIIRASSPKYQVHNNALLSAYQTRGMRSVQEDSAAWGRVVESAVGAHLINEVRSLTNSHLYYWRKDNNEVDFVLAYGENLLGIEVKSFSGSAEHKGLTAFKKEHPTANTLLVGDVISWQELLETPIIQLIR
jgi:predicted AAA+ superfamily ATPase